MNQVQSERQSRRCSSADANVVTSGQALDVEEGRFCRLSRGPKSLLEVWASGVATIAQPDGAGSCISDRARHLRSCEASRHRQQELRVTIGQHDREGAPLPADHVQSELLFNLNENYPFTSK